MFFYHAAWICRLLARKICTGICQWISSLPFEAGLQQCSRPLVSVGSCTFEKGWKSFSKYLKLWRVVTTSFSYLSKTLSHWGLKGYTESDWRTGPRQRTLTWVQWFNLVADLFPNTCFWLTRSWGIVNMLCQKGLVWVETKQLWFEIYVLSTENPCSW